jgi:hypothetical protein
MFFIYTLPDIIVSQFESITGGMAPGRSSVAEEDLFPVIDVSFKESFIE